MLDNRLDDRKKAILRAVIDDYIFSGEPIGSRTIARKYELGFSSATIRNEMADLEEMGYLAQPHTSAGRVPSDKGYRLYVDQLMQLTEMSMDDIIAVKSMLEAKINQLDTLIRQTSMVLSTITDYISVITSPDVSGSVLKAVQAVPLDTGRALIVVVADSGAVRNSIVGIPDDVTPEFLINISNVLNNRLRNMTIEQITFDTIQSIKKDLSIRNDVLLPIIDGVVSCVNNMEGTKVYTEGVANVFKFPEFTASGKARDIISMIDKKSVISKIMEPSADIDDISVHIGKENIVNDINECTLVTATYSSDGRVMGTIGLIGPTRMNYSKVIPAMKFIRTIFKEEFQKLADENKL